MRSSSVYSPHRSPRSPRISPPRWQQLLTPCRLRRSRWRMTLFLDVRVDSSGGPLASSVTFYEGSSLSTYRSISRAQLLRAIHGRNLLIGTHGFNVNRADGIDC